MVKTSLSRPEPTSGAMREGRSDLRRAPHLVALLWYTQTEYAAGMS
jgi:hypothetical protein